MRTIWIDPTPDYTIVVEENGEIVEWEMRGWNSGAQKSYKLLADAVQQSAHRHGRHSRIKILNDFHNDCLSFHHIFQRDIEMVPLHWAPEHVRQLLLSLNRV
jgi:hypothetical protein